MEISHTKEALYFAEKNFSSLIDSEPYQYESEECEKCRLDFSMEGMVISKNGILSILLPVHEDPLLLNKINWKELKIYSHWSPAKDNIFGLTIFLCVFRKFRRKGKEKHSILSMLSLMKKSADLIHSSTALRFVFFYNGEVVRCFDCPDSFNTNFKKLVDINFKSLLASQKLTSTEDIFFDDPKLCRLKSIWLHTNHEFLKIARGDSYKLFSGWHVRFEKKLLKAHKSISKILNIYLSAEERLRELLCSPNLTKLLDSLISTNDFSKRIDLLVSEALSSEGFSFMGDFANFSGDINTRIDLSHIYSAIKLHPKLTNYGLNFVTDKWSSGTWVPESHEINCTEVKEVKNFWKSFPVEYRIPSDLIDFSHEHINLSHKKINLLPKTKSEDLEETNNVARELLDAVDAFGRWNIPNEALVEVNLPVFSHLQLSESQNIVFVKAISMGGGYALFSICLEEKKLIYNTLESQVSGFSSTGEIKATELFSEENLNRLMEVEGVKNEKLFNDIQKIKSLEQIETALFLILSSIIHDFKVPEYRENTYSASFPNRSKLPKNLKDEKVRIVYLPRVIYKSEPNLNGILNEIKEHGAVSKHYVSHHLRKINGEASQIQKSIARRYGFNRIPEGHTFVSGHYRGDNKREVIYKSRSASKYIFQEKIESSSQSSQVEWFQFERDVVNLLKSLGLSVAHKAASKNGDGGVDIIAEEKGKLDIIHWLVQCKCWKNIIEPSVVREMIGTLALDSHKGARGLIVTTSSFSQGAKQLAEEYKIKTIDGAQFYQMIKESEVSP
jgi:HJR/Mrr/RecB family endonuclease